MAKTLRELAEFLGGTVEGGGDVAIDGLAGAAEAGPAELTFITDPRYLRELEASRAAAVLTRAELRERVRAAAGARPLLIVADPDGALARLVDLFVPVPPRPAAGVAPTAAVAEDARLGEGVAVLPLAYVGARAEIGDRTVLHPGAHVGEGARLGADCVLHANAVVAAGVSLGSRVVIHAGAVIGADGFGYRQGPEGLVKLRHVGTVVIEDDVEIGACATVDRARFGRTVVRRGAKLDNLVQVAHNVRIGAHTVIAAQTGISGSAVLGGGCVIGGQAGIVGHVRIGDRATIAARSGISKDVPEGAVLYGFVARHHADKKREEAALRRLPELVRRVRDLESRLAALEGRAPRERDS